MTQGAIPIEVEQFLRSHISSVAHLEALLLLRGDPETAWNCPTLAVRLFVREEQIARIVPDLIRAGLVTEGPTGAGSYRYAPVSPAMAALVEKTAETYRTRLVAVAQFIHAQERSSLHAFADAFRMKG